MPRESKPVSSARQAYAYIQARLADGTYSPGMRLTEEQLARDLGTSRTPVREAMRLMVADGYLHFKPNSGTFVRSWSLEQAGDIYDARLMVECEMAARATTHLSDAQIDQMALWQDEIESRGADLSEENLLRIRPINKSFHRMLGDNCGSERLMAMRGYTVEVQLIQQTYHHYTAAQLTRSFAHHREMIDALRARDPEWARAVMACHLRAAKHALLDGRDKAAQV